MNKNKKLVMGLGALAIATTAYATVIAQQTAPNVIAERTTTDFDTKTIVANQGVKDSKTGLIWKACLEGQRLANNGTSCSGPLTEVTSFEQAKALEKDGWRLPTIKELTSITDHSKAYPAFNTSVLPFATGITFDTDDTTKVAIWSKTVSPLKTDHQDNQNFALSIYNGKVEPVNQNAGTTGSFTGVTAKYVLLVKDSQ